jgi:O-antigen/teichoic acid export membrane protein
LLIGGRLRGVLVAQGVAMLVIAVWVWRELRRFAKIRLTFRPETLKHLLREGAPFLLLNLSVALQPNVDAILMARLASPESLGWFAVAKKVVGVLIFPVSALATAFYPTWARLWTDDRERFQRSFSTGLRASAVLVAPLSLGCAIYPDLAVRAFSRHSYGPAETDLRVLSLFVLALFFSMVLSTGLAAAGRSRPWAACQFGCVIVSAVLDPILVPYFQTRYGNGSLGVCVSIVVSETLMVVGGLALLPKGVLDRGFARALGLTAVSAIAMAATARALSHLNPFIAAPISVVAYGACLWATGGVDPALAELFRQTIARRFRRPTA